MIKRSGEQSISYLWIVILVLFLTKLCIYSIFWSCLEEMYLLIHCVLVLMFMDWKSKPTVQNTFRIWEIWSRTVKDTNITGQRADMITLASQSWISGNISYLVQHKKTMLIKKKKKNYVEISLKSMIWWKQGSIHLVFFKVVFFALAQVCSMQRFNTNSPGRNRGVFDGDKAGNPWRTKWLECSRNFFFFKKAEKAKK